MAQAGVPSSHVSLWGEAVSYVVHLRNLIPQIKGPQHAGTC
jgi:hypothetical protein